MKSLTKDKTKTLLFFFSCLFLIGGMIFVFMHPDKMASLGFFVPASTALFGGIGRNGMENFRKDLKEKVEMNTKSIKEVNNKIEDLRCLKCQKHK